MSTTKKIALNLLGIGLTLTGVLLLPFGFFQLMAGIAWSNGSAGDILLLSLYALYTFPAGFGALTWGIVLLRSTNEEAYVPPSVRSQKQIGLCLLLPVIAAALLLMIGYPHYRFWIPGAWLGIFLTLFAAGLFVLGIHLLKDADRHAQA